MLEAQEFLQVSISMIEHEVMRALIHPLHEAIGIADDGDALSPSECRCEEACYLYVLFLGEAVRDGDRIIFYKGWLIKLHVFLLQQCMYLVLLCFLFHDDRLCQCLLQVFYQILYILHSDREAQEGVDDTYTLTLGPWDRCMCHSCRMIDQRLDTTERLSE